MYSCTLGELLPEATPAQDGLMPMELSPIQLTDNGVWYEVLTNGPFYYIYLHPYYPIIACATLYSDWGQTTGFIKVLINASSLNVNDYIRTSGNSNIRKIYVKSVNSIDGAAKTYIVPIIGNKIVARKTSDILD